MVLFYILLALLLGSIGSVGIASILLLLPDKQLSKLSELLVSLAGGTLLGAAFLGMLPKAVSMLEQTLVFQLVLAGIFLFFIIEKFILWRSCHNKDCSRHQNASAQLILIGDAFHNFIDGVIIVSAFHGSITFGIAVSLSVFAHEIPQEIADFGILIKNGFSRKRAVYFNMLSGATALLGGLLTFYILDVAKNLVPYILAFSASSFLYIALADLVPQMHKTTNPAKSIIQILLIILGAGIILLIKSI